MACVAVWVAIISFLLFLLRCLRHFLPDRFGHRVTPSTPSCLSCLWLALAGGAAATYGYHPQLACVAFLPFCLLSLCHCLLCHYHQLPCRRACRRARPGRTPTSTTTHHQRKGVRRIFPLLLADRGSNSYMGRAVCFWQALPLKEVEGELGLANVFLGVGQTHAILPHAVCDGQQLRLGQPVALH